MTFTSGSSNTPTYGRVNPLLQYQAGFDTANVYHVSEKVLTFAENVPGQP
jgi:hypothetical protein